MNLVNDSVKLSAIEGSVLVMAIDCDAGEVKDSLVFNGAKEVDAFQILAVGGDREKWEKSGFSTVTQSDNDIKNTEEGVAFVTSSFPNVHAIILCMGSCVKQSRANNYALLCANVDASIRLVLVGNDICFAAKYVNIHCQPSEAEWAESDGGAIACTLYGSVGKDSSGLHSAYLGKAAYERFIDSYYLDDLLKTAYTGYAPEKFYYVLYFALVWFEGRRMDVSLTELGATLWATIDKIDLCESKLGCGYDSTKVEWNSIELSDYLRRLSHLLHGNQKLNFFDRWQSYHRSDVDVGFSHLVSPYAFHDMDSTIDWVRKFKFCLWVSDFTLSATMHLKVNGKSWTLLPLDAAIEKLQGLGFDVYLLDARDLDREGQIKRASLVIVDKSSFSMDEYLSAIDAQGGRCELRRDDFRAFDFAPSSLWDKVISDPAYFNECAKTFSAGFAGALAITPTKPYEFRFSSEKLNEKVAGHLNSVRGGVAEGFSISKVREGIGKAFSRLFG